jgi:hypothetical protein
MKAFNVINNKGFQIKVNDWAISVMFGTSNYCDNGSFNDVDTVKTLSRLECENAEIAVWKDDENQAFDIQWMQDLGYVKDLTCCDCVMGHINSDDLVKVINWCATH